MKATLERADLLRSLSHLQRIPDRKNTMPILANVRLQADKDNLVMKVTDLEIEVTDSISATVEQKGMSTVSVQIFCDIVRKLPEGVQISLELDEKGESINIVAGRSRFTLPTLAESDFPDLGSDELPHKFEVGAAELKALIDRTLFAISAEESRYYLNGIFMHIVDNGSDKLLRSVTTDGHRLAQANIAAPEGSDEMPDIILPKKTAGEIQKLLENSDEKVKIELSQTKICIRLDHIELVSKLIEGTFPDYTRVIPQKNDKELQVNKNDFSNAVDRVSTIGSDRICAVKMALSEQRMDLSFSNPSNGNASEELEVEFGHSKLDIGFNSRYLLEITSQLRSEKTLFKLSDPSQPAIIQNSDTEDTLYVVMPMRV